MIMAAMAGASLAGLRGLTPLHSIRAPPAHSPLLFRQQHKHSHCHECRAASGTGEPAQPAGSGPSPAEQKQGFGERIKQFFGGGKLEKEKLAALGMGAFASYGVISNVTYGVCLTIAWVSFVKAKGISPLAPGQWPAFLAFYAGLWTIQNFVRPMRFALAVALAPAFEKLIAWIGQKTGAKKPVAFGILLAVIAIITTASLFSAIYLLGGFPPIPADAVPPK